ncbi:Cathepsin-6 [Apodemus speciosus]|uniref:Cathepsin-6 n=1 Tax=Apodemus speciosus TaxID=105296 RepID=A0ABQ0FGA8_APOSI
MNEFGDMDHAGTIQIIVRLKSQDFCFPESEDILMEAVATIGPISDAVDVSFNRFGFYNKCT